MAKAKIVSRHRASTSSRTSFHFLNTPEKKARYTQLRAQLDAKSKEVERMRSKIATINEKSGVQLGELSSDFKSVMEDMTATVHDKYPEGSFRRSFGMNR